MTSSLTDLSRWSSRIEQNKTELQIELNRWKTYQEEYNALETQLQTLSDETVRPAMIPFGKLAFMPGKLIHTNEITVYLGDQYYVERSTKQALGILQRRKEVVDENLRLVEAQWNAMKAKSDTVNKNLFPSAEGVNEEGLPIMEIREEIPDSPPKSPINTNNNIEQLPISSSSSSTQQNLDDNNDLMKMLDALELEEEEEEREKQQQLMEKQLDFFEMENDRNNNDDYDDEDLDDIYDTEIADNMFDHFEDDEDYATQGVVDQEDFTIQDDLNDTSLENRNKIESIDTEEPIKEIVAERLETKPSTTTTFTEMPTTSTIDDIPPPPTKKKISKFKQLQMESQKDNETTSVIDDEQPKKPVNTMPKFKVQKPADRKRKQQQQQPSPVSPPISSSHIPDVIPQESTKEIGQSSSLSTVQQRISPPPEDKPKKKVSKFKQFQEQQRQQQKTSIVSTTKSKTNKPKKGTPIDVPHKDIENLPHSISMADHSTNDTSSINNKKVSWKMTTSVREHDRLSAPQADPQDTYNKPLKEADQENQSMQTVIRSPSDIFRVVKQHQPKLEEDGYPSLDRDDTLSTATIQVDLRDLASSVSLTDPIPMWRPNYEVDEDKLPITQPFKSSTPQATIMTPKSKMDTNTMRGVVMERESEELDLDEVTDDMDFKEIKSTYQQQRQNMLATMGGLSFDVKPEFEVFDEDLPLPTKEKSNSEKRDEPEKPKKMSRFKAARMGLKNDDQ
ncbi:Prefoldin subunit-domain-containing protein [Halteromyces radiatus]|uniref:Prefoldin subunit-domain-containing protein n=1 Tax=Halteromyces radiatus TaxID=101107 RepID=UPI002220C36C|nr:Prefoldin subunit-domain-containing protein [Halteromyces radiatus]KAI8089756.1 Prefoldin subunit-domain-containing protein [Halteromyces radiatus]